VDEYVEGIFFSGELELSDIQRAMFGNRTAVLRIRIKLGNLVITTIFTLIITIRAAA
jgi:hypothetical protein